MQYMLMLYSDETGWTRLTPAEQKRWMGAYQAYAEALAKAGVFKGSHHLQSASLATTMRVTDGKPQVLDGPFVDSKEQIGGYFIIDVPDLDAAIACFPAPAASHGVVEVRAMVPPARERPRAEWSRMAAGTSKQRSPRSRGASQRLAARRRSGSSRRHRVRRKAFARRGAE
jgi:hypothetical protein